MAKKVKGKQKPEEKVQVQHTNTAPPPPEPTHQIIEPENIPHPNLHEAQPPSNWGVDQQWSEDSNTGGWGQQGGDGWGTAGNLLEPPVANRLETIYEQPSTSTVHQYNQNRTSRSNVSESHSRSLSYTESYQDGESQRWDNVQDNIHSRTLTATAAPSATGSPLPQQHRHISLAEAAAAAGRQTERRTNLAGEAGYRPEETRAPIHDYSVRTPSIMPSPAVHQSNLHGHPNSVPAKPLSTASAYAAQFDKRPRPQSAQTAAPARPGKVTWRDDTPLFEGARQPAPIPKDTSWVTSGGNAWSNRHRSNQGGGFVMRSPEAEEAWQAELRHYRAAEELAKQQLAAKAQPLPHNPRHHSYPAAHPSHHGQSQQWQNGQQNQSWQGWGKPEDEDEEGSDEGTINDHGFGQGHFDPWGSSKPDQYQHIQQQGKKQGKRQPQAQGAWDQGNSAWGQGGGGWEDEGAAAWGTAANPANRGEQDQQHSNSAWGQEAGWRQSGQGAGAPGWGQGGHGGGDTWGQGGFGREGGGAKGTGNGAWDQGTHDSFAQQGDPWSKQGQKLQTKQDYHHERHPRQSHHQGRQHRQAAWNDDEDEDWNEKDEEGNEEEHEGWDKGEAWGKASSHNEWAPHGHQSKVIFNAENRNNISPHDKFQILNSLLKQTQSQNTPITQMNTHYGRTQHLQHVLNGKQGHQHKKDQHQEWGAWEAEDHSYPGGDGEYESRRVRFSPKASDIWGGSPRPIPSKTLEHAQQGIATTPINDALDRVRFIESRGAAFAYVSDAFFSNKRLARERLYWMFPTEKDKRVADMLAWVQKMSYNLGTFGLMKFLETRERGALFINTLFRMHDYPKDPALDWLTFNQLQGTMDKTLQESVAFYDPSQLVIAFVYLPSQTGQSVAIWRRKINVPDNARLKYRNEITTLKQSLRELNDYIVMVDEIPKKKLPEKAGQLRKSAPGQAKTDRRFTQPKEKQRKWWKLFLS